MRSTSWTCRRPRARARPRPEWLWWATPSTASRPRCARGCAGVWSRPCARWSSAPTSATCGRGGPSNRHRQARGASRSSSPWSPASTRRTGYGPSSIGPRPAPPTASPGSVGSCARSWRRRPPIVTRWAPTATPSMPAATPGPSSTWRRRTRSAGTSWPASMRRWCGWVARWQEARWPKRWRRWTLTPPGGSRALAPSKVGYRSCRTARWRSSTAPTSTSPRPSAPSTATSLRPAATRRCTTRARARTSAGPGPCGGRCRRTRRPSPRGGT